MSIKALSDYTLYARYAKYNESEQRRETWGETVDRVFDMHERKYEKQLEASEELRGYFAEAKDGLLDKRILGSQRALQFGGNPIERKNAKLFNCAFGHICYDRVFNEIMHLLLCGCGVGFSVQKHHIKQLSNLVRLKPDAQTEVFIAEDSIEGWADCVAALMSSYFETPLEGFEKYQGKRVQFDLSLIRPEGANIDGGFKAPGPDGLLASLTKIGKLLNDVTDNAFFGVGEYADKLTPIDAYDIIMHLSDAVLSGGVRRSATICLFSLDDKQMMDAKTGNWFNENPQRGRSNNSAVLVRSKSTKEEFMEVKQRVKEFGEPAFVFVDDEECGVNPCCVGGSNMINTTEGLKPVVDLVGEKFTAIVDGVEYDSTDNGFWETGTKMVNDYYFDNDGLSVVRMTSDHRVKTKHGYVEAGDLTIDSPVVVGESGLCALMKVVEIGEEVVYDCTIPIADCFDSDGIIVHNCEIVFRPVTEDGRHGFQFCVAGDTKLITRNGIADIKEYVGIDVDVWNGEEWSSVNPYKTGDNDTLYRVYFSDGSYLDATKNHKFLVKQPWQKTHNEQDTSWLFEKYAGGDLGRNKYSVPRGNITVHEGGELNTNAFDYGFFLGDGCVDHNQLVAYLYNSDKEIDFVSKNIKPKTYINYNGTEYKKIEFDNLDYTLAVSLKHDIGLPRIMFEWDRNSVLDFISGWADADGCNASNGIRIYGREDKIRDGQLLLRKNGINASVNLMQEAGVETNLGIRKNAVWYLQITKTDELVCQRLTCDNDTDNKFKGKLQYITKIVKLAGTHESFCLTEDKLHQCVFNNVLTKQCNLSTVNGKFATDEDKFLRASREASIIGTIQAGYTNFSYVGSSTKELTEKESLLGVSITGVMDSPEITLDPEIQRKGAKVVLDTNLRVAELLGINPAARATCVKPEGSASCVLGTSSGIHPHHAKRYFRRVQANKMEYPVKYFSMFNPQAIEESVWSANKTDEVITFLCEVPKGSITKNQLNAIELLDNVKLTQQNWVESGTVPERGNKPYLRHNVSNTISVGDEEWDEVFEYLWENKECFTGVSMVSTSGDKDYPQAPFCTVYTPKEIVSEYGDASMFASGMITAALEAFENNLWSACSHALGIEQLNGEVDKAYGVFLIQERVLVEARSRMDVSVDPVEREALTAIIEQLEDEVITLDEIYLNTLDRYETKQDWLRRAQQFSDRYFDGDVRRMTYCLKDVYNFKVWVDLSRDYIEVDWSKAYEEREVSVAADTMAAASCAGGACEIM